MRPAEFMSNVTRFWQRVDKSGDCWLWTGEKNRFGYGRFIVWHDGTRTRILAHRLALHLIGEDLAPEAVVMHTCDNPPCVNPRHLSIGTQADNIRDCVAKGRADLHGLELSRNRLIAKARREAQEGAA